MNDRSRLRPPERPETVPASLDADRVMFLAFRRALLAAAKAIEKRYGVSTIESHRPNQDDQEAA
jgi:hypothetical protein